MGTNLPLIGLDPVTSPEAWDSFKLAGQWSPGVCHFNLPTRDLGWDVQSSSGTTGGAVLRHKMPPVTFDVEIYLWKGDDENGGDVDHFSTWEQFKKLLLTPLKKTQANPQSALKGAVTTSALDIYHPQLAGLAIPITSVVVKSFTEPQPDGEGGGRVKITFIEYRPVVVNPVANTLGAKPSTKSDPLADLRKQVAKATDDFENT